MNDYVLKCAMRVSALQKRRLAALAAAALVLFAGCSGFTPGETTTTTAETTDEMTTSTTTVEPATSTTAEPTTTTTQDGSNGTDTDDSDSADTGSAAEADVSGTMTVLLGGSQVALDGNDGAVTFRDGDRRWFTSENDVTIAAALVEQGVEVTNSTLTYDGTTYDEASDGTTVEVRVDGRPVDPTEYTLQDGDSVWVYVDSPNLAIEPPGEYIKQAQDHQHGTIEVVVDGESLNLSKEQYQHMDRHFHLEGGDGDTWHAHTWQATFAWAMGTLDIDVTNESVTIEGTTYDDTEDGTTVRFLVNGDAIEDPADYRLKDGDQIRIVVEQSG